MVLFCSKRQTMEAASRVLYMQKTNAAEEKYSSYELEFLLLFAALKKYEECTCWGYKTLSATGIESHQNYQHIITVIDAFTKFSWLYPVKTVSADSVLDKLRLQQKTFGNLKRIITDRGSAFTSKAFNDYCAEEEIQHLQIAAGVPRSNGQVERVHRTLIPVLTKLSLDDPTK
ncbi:transposon Tf2-6 polyprotein [Trichonephila inaurata madagascariensis]|uniref:Transposon Tf2-6 polyprotein n=1 Tax=Trichonephila inaurata madagascariensis TaxID=2747483 RepID=A0A8X6WSH2_9ARAC|nr:transposon Tf2-6 polyprotein [Trichonephila inaurata madagascariensis]